MARPIRKVVDGGTITVHVPIVLRKRGGRKTVAMPDGRAALSSPRLRLDDAIVKALARAFHWRKLIETGVCSTIQEIADAERVSASYVGRILRLTLLAPDVVETLLDLQGTTGRLDSLMKPLPRRWAEQREALGIE